MVLHDFQNVMRSKAEKAVGKKEGRGEMIGIALINPSRPLQDSFDKLNLDQHFLVVDTTP